MLSDDDRPYLVLSDGSASSAESGGEEPAPDDAPAVTGRLVLVLLVASASGFWLRETRDWPDSTLQEESLVGVVLGHWVFVAAAHASSGDVWQCTIQSWASRQCQATRFHGWINFKAERVWVFCRPPELHANAWKRPTQLFLRFKHESLVEAGVFVPVAARSTLQELLERTLAGRLKVLACALAPKFLECVLHDATKWSCLHSVVLASRVARNRLVGNLPVSGHCGKLRRFLPSLEIVWCQRSCRPNLCHGLFLPISSIYWRGSMRPRI